METPAEAPIEGPQAPLSLEGAAPLSSPEDTSPTTPCDTASDTTISPNSTTPALPQDEFNLDLSDARQNRLCQVLDSLPLIYLPHTKQLVPNCDHHVSKPRERAASLKLSPSPLQDQQVPPPLDQIPPPLDQIPVPETEDAKSNTSMDLDTVDMLGSGRAAITFQKGPDCSSLTSLSSISTDYSLSALGEDLLDLRFQSPDLDDDVSGLMEINLHSRNTFDKSSTLSSLDSGIDDSSGAKHKQRRGLTHLARTLFSKKSKDKLSIPTVSAPGWRLFGRVPPGSPPEAPPGSPASPPEAREPSLHSSVGNLSIRSCSPVESRKKDIEVSSTSGLVLEERPDTLPPKPESEAMQHQQEYTDIMEAAKKKEQKDQKKRKQEQHQQLQKEEKIANAVKVWKTEILPNWNTLRDTKRIRELWWAGIPPSVRGKVWRLAIGNQLEITQEMCDEYLRDAKERLDLLDFPSTPHTEDDVIDADVTDCPPPGRPVSPSESSIELIRLDVSRTFPQLGIFQKGGPYYDLLLNLLEAYTSFKPDVGYVQGMSFLAAILLLNMDADDAFICFANLLHKPCLVAFFGINENLMKCYFLTYEEFFHYNLPKLYSHFRRHNLTPDLYLIDWVYSLFSRSLPLDVASRVWDVYCRDGEEFLFRTALGILKMYEEVLLSLDFIHLAQFLTRLPDSVCPHQLFRAVSQIRMNCEKRQFLQVFDKVRTTLTGS